MYLLAIKHEPKHAEALGNLANLYSARDDLKKAAATYERALRAKPDHTENVKNFAKLKKRMSGK
jgi:Tfp pilus assembly protein PilF